MAGRVIVVGSVNVDLVVRTPRLPAPGETVTGGTFERHHGGKGGNQAVAAARLGATVEFVGAIGDDAFGQEARAALANEGIGLAGLATIPGVATGVAVIVVDAAGENAIAVDGGANAALEPGDVASAMGKLAIRAADVVLVGHEIPTRTARRALETARRAGATTILNPAPAEGLDDDLLRLADFVTPNRAELATLAGVEDEPHRMATALRQRLGGRLVLVVSVGSEGTLLIDGEHDLPIAARRVSVVDTVGAGDTLNGALAAFLAEGRDPPVAAAMANQAAGLAVTRSGAREGMPTRAELDAAMAPESPDRG